MRRQKGGLYDAVGRLGNSDGGAFLQYIAVGSKHPLLAFMICNAIGSIALGHMADRVAAALDTALIRICLLRMILIAMLLPPVAHALGLLYVNVVFAALGLRWTAAPSARSRCVHQPPVRPETEI